MQIFVSGKHVDVGTSLHDYVVSELENSVKKYFEHAVSADVVFTKTRHLFQVDVIVNEGTGNQQIIKARAEDDDAYAAFENALTRITKQLRKYKERIKNHHKSRLDKNFELIDATKYVIAPEVETKQAGETSPVIIAEKSTEIETLTVSDAVMRMDLGHLPALMFINKKTNSVNVVYRREDGNISWIDSSNNVKTSSSIAKPANKAGKKAKSAKKSSKAETKAAKPAKVAKKATKVAAKKKKKAA